MHSDRAHYKTILSYGLSIIHLLSVGSILSFLYFKRYCRKIYASAIQMFVGGMVGEVGWWAYIGGFIAGILFRRYFLKRERYN